MMLLDLLKTTAELFRTVHPGGSKSCAIVNHVCYEGSPVTVCPDVHGRPELVKKALAAPGPVVFVGDIIHREDNEIWKRMLVEQKGPLHERPEFHAEVEANLTCWKLILEAKEKDPDRIHFVRGNHDDTEGVLMGNYSKGFFSSEAWKEGLYDLNSAFCKRMIEFERSIPYVYLGWYENKTSPNIIVTHSFPHMPSWTKTPKLNHPETHDTYSWSDNTSYNSKWDQYPTHVLDELMASQFASDWSTLDHWFVGHRPVNEGLARVQKDGKVVQINNQKQHVLLTYDPAEQGQKWQASLV